MTPSLMVAGGIDPAEIAEPDIAQPEGAPPIRVRYPTYEASDSSYAARIEPIRLLAIVRPTEHGYIAHAAVLNALGYGDTPGSALDDLADSIRQYLEFIRDDEPQLAASVAHHARYVSLLEMPRGSWFAWVRLDASPLE